MVKRYDELKKGDVIKFHGAELELIAVCIDKPAPANEYYPNDCVIRFDTKPFGKFAVEVIGNFYANGTYGGVGSLTAEVIEK